MKLTLPITGAVWHFPGHNKYEMPAPTLNSVIKKVQYLLEYENIKEIKSYFEFENSSDSRQYVFWPDSIYSRMMEGLKKII